MRRWIVLTVLLLTFAGGSLAQEDQCFERGGVWDAEAERCALQANLEISLAYPVVAMETPFVAEIIDAWYTQMRTDYSQWFAQQPYTFSGSGNWFVGVSYEEYWFSPEVVTLAFTVADYTGGAHPNSYFRTMTFNLTEQTTLALDDVLADGALPEISALVQADLIAQMTELMGGEPDTEWIETGTGENPDNFANFALSEDALIFYFSPYQVAAYAMGPFTVSLNLADIQPLLKPEFQQVS